MLSENAKNRKLKEIGFTTTAIHNMSAQTGIRILSRFYSKPWKSEFSPSEMEIYISVQNRLYLNPNLKGN